MAIFINKSNRNRELSQIAAMQLEIDALLLDPTIDLSIKDMVLQDLALTLSTIQKDGMVGSNARLYLIGVQGGVKQKLAGELGYSPSAVGSAVKNAFGKYSPEEINWMVNETLRRSAQPLNNDTDEPTYDTPSQLGQLVFVFDPAQEGTKIYKIAGSTPDKQQAVKAFASYLLGQLLNANNILSDSGNALHGWDSSNNQYLGQWLQLLASAGSGTDLDLNSQILEMGNIINLLKNENLQNMYEDNFQHWLEGFVPEKKSTPAGTPTISIDGQDIQTVDYIDEYANSLIKQKGWKVIKDGDVYKAYLIGGDGQPRAVANKQIINIDPTDRSTWKMAVITDDNGVISYGNLGSDEFIRSLSPARWAEVQEAIRLAHVDHFGSPANEIAKGLGRYIDLSNFFIGDEPIIYKLGDDENTDPLWIDWDALGNMDKFVFAGNTDASATGNSVDDLYLKSQGYPENIDDIPTFDEQLARERFAGNSNDSGDINLRGLVDPTYSDNLVYSHGHLSDAITRFVYLQLKYTIIGLSLNPNKAAELEKVEAELLNLCPNYTDQVRLKGSKQEIDLGEAMMKQIENDASIYPSILKSILTNPDMLDVRQGVIALLGKYTKSNKHGGILSAGFGASMPESGNDADDSELEESDERPETTQMNTEAGYLSDSPLDQQTRRGMNALIASAIFDFVDLVTPNNFRKAGRVISPTMSTLSTAADIYAATQLDMTAGQKAWMFGSDALNMGLSYAPLLSKSSKMERFQAALASRKIQIALGAAGIGAAGLGSIFTMPEALTAISKIYEGKHEELTPLDLHALVVQANLLLGGAKGISSVTHGVKSVPIKKSNLDVYIDTKGPNGREATKVKDSDIQAARDRAKEEAEKASWPFKKLREFKERKKAMAELAPEGYTVRTNIFGEPKTKPSYEYDDAKVAQTRIYLLLKRGSKPSVVKNPSMFNLKDAPYFGFKGLDWDFNLFKRFKGLEPTVRVIKTPDNGEFTAFEVSMSDYDEAIKQFLPKVKKGQTPSTNTDVINALFGPTGMPTGTKVAQSDNIIVYAVPGPIAPARSKGGRLLRLHTYLIHK